jgi:hypothetical protein
VREQLVAKYELEDDALEGPVMKESLKMAITTAAVCPAPYLAGAGG